jgi:DNA modification methylase
VITITGLNELKRLLGIVSLIIIDNLPHGSEDYVPMEKIDMTFTSPPYFNLERYADDEDTQSYQKYLTETEYFDGFLKLTILNSLTKLKVGGLMIFNFRNTKIFTDKDIWLDGKIREYAIGSGLVELVSPFPQYISRCSSSDFPLGTEAEVKPQDMMILIFIKWID